MKERPAPFYTPEERVELRKMIKMSPTLAAVVAGWAASVIERLLDSLEAAESSLARKGTVHCPHCDFASGQRGGDRCPKCDGTGRVSAISLLAEERDYLQQQLAAERARAEKAEAERDAARLVSNHYTCAASVRNQDVS